MADPTTSSELDAVNVILASIGETPTTQDILTAGSSADVAMAKQILTEVSKEIQAEGWHFNTDYEVELTPNISNHIVLADNVARVDLESGNEGGQDVTQRYDSVSSEQRLYNKKDNDYEFLAPVKATVVYMFDFVGLPETAKRFITVRACRLFQDRLLGSKFHHQFSQVDEFRALADLKEWEGNTADHSIFDTYGMAKITRGNTIR